MKVNILEAHDRLQYLTKQPFDIGKTCQNIIDQRPFGDHAFYIFAHKREIGTDERIALFNQDWQIALTDPSYTRQYLSIENVPTHRLIWQPRLTKPKAQENSMLFKAYPGTDVIKIIWMIPQKELWEQYTKDKMTGNGAIWQSIEDFKNNPRKLEAKEDDDLDDDAIDTIYRQISQSTKPKKFEMI